MTHNIRLSVLVLALIAALPASADDKPRPVPDTPASFTLTGEEYWVVVAVRQDGEAAIGLARDQIGEYPKAQVARTRDGKYAVLVGPVAKMTDAELKEKFSEGRGLTFAGVAQSRGEEFVARAWQNPEPLARGEMQEGKPVTLTAGALTVTLRVQEVRKKKKEDTEYVIVGEGRENGKPAFTTRSEALYSPQPAARVSVVKLDGATPQVVMSHYTGGAHCCMRSVIATRDAAGKWQVLRAGAIDGTDGPAFEDLDGDGTFELISADNRFLYQFDAYAGSRMPAKIEKVIGGKLVDVTRRPEYRRFHQQYLAAMEARTDEEEWTHAGFLSGWAAQKVLLGEGAEAFERLQKIHDPGTGAPFEECTISRPVEKCPEKNKKTVSFAEALRKFLDKNGYR
jgi:serine protease Do